MQGHMTMIMQGHSFEKEQIWCEKSYQGQRTIMQWQRLLFQKESKTLNVDIPNITPHSRQNWLELQCRKKQMNPPLLLRLCSPCQEQPTWAREVAQQVTWKHKDLSRRHSWWSKPVIPALGGRDRRTLGLAELYIQWKGLDSRHQGRSKTGGWLTLTSAVQ